MMARYEQNVAAPSDHVSEWRLVREKRNRALDGKHSLFEAKKLSSFISFFSVFFTNSSEPSARKQSQRERENLPGQVFEHNSKVAETEVPRLSPKGLWVERAYP